MPNSRPPPPPDPRREAELKAIERAKAQCTETLAKMKDTTPNEAARLHERVKGFCTNKSLPIDFKSKMLEAARKQECFANMRATDQALHEAAHLAAEEQMKLRGTKLTEGRKLFAKACTLGADEEFRKAAQRLMETIMMTGGVHHPGPSRAKPLDFAPKNPNKAKV